MSEPSAPAETIDSGAPAAPLLPVPPTLAQRLEALGEVLVCSSLPTQLLIGLVLRAAGWSPGGDGEPLSLSFVAPLMIIDTVLVVGLMTFFIRMRGERPRDIWLGPRPWWPEVRFGLALIPVIVVAAIVLLNLLRLLVPWLHSVPENPMGQLAGETTGEALLFALVAIVGGGVREELQRAFMLHRFERYLGGASTGFVVVSVAFGLGHIAQGYDAVVTTALMGALWAGVYLRRRSCVAPMVSHAGFNSLEVLRIALVSGAR